MKALRFDRHAPMISLSVAFVLAAALVMRVSAAPAAQSPGHLGQALALSAALNSSKAFFQGVADEGAFDPRHSADGRFIYSPEDLAPHLIAHANGTSLIPVNEPVQTFDIFAPPPAFLPVIGPPYPGPVPAAGTLDTSAATQLTPTNKDQIWTADQSYIIFASNRSLTNPLAVGTNFHLWAAPATGDSPPFPLTKGNGNEEFPAINGNDLAFVSTAQPGTTTPGTYYNLYTLQFNRSSTAATAVDPSTLTAPLENLNDSSNAENDNFGSTKTFGDSATFTDVARPTWSPSGDRIVFSAYTTAPSDAYNGNYHLYFLYVNTNGYQASTASGTANPPAELTDGPANDTDPAWEPAGNGDYIAFATTATAIENNPTTNSGTAANPTVGSAGIGPERFPTLTESPSSVGDRTIFVIGGGPSTFGFTPQGGGQITTVANTDNFGPAWSSTNPNEYINPENGHAVYDYLAWARSGSAATATTPAVAGGPNVPHAIYYLRAIGNVGTALLTPEGTALTVDTGETNTTTGQPVTTTETNAAVHLNTDDNSQITAVTTTTNGTTTTTFSSSGANQYDDIYPTWSPFLSVYSIAYSSNRSITYNYPAATTVFTSTLGTGAPVTYPAGAPSETAISLAQGQYDVAAGSGTTTYNINPTGGTYAAHDDIPGQFTSGPTSYTGILQSQVLNLDPPTLLDFSASNVVEVVDGENNTDVNPQDGQRVINPGDYVTFLVRLSDREAGISNNGANALPDVYLQIKDPNSKYQDPQHIEHKVFARPDWYYEVTDQDTPTDFYEGIHATGTILHARPDSGSSTLLTETWLGNSEDEYDTGTGLDLNGDGSGATLNFADGKNTLILPSGTDTGTVGVAYAQVGSVAGPDRHSPIIGNISVGKDGGVPNTGGNTPNNDNTVTYNTGTSSVTAHALPLGADAAPLAGGNWKNFIPSGPEYECQYINPSITATGRDPSTTTGDYGTPYYLAGYDDQGSFNGYDPTGGDAGAADITPPNNVHPIPQTDVEAGFEAAEEGQTVSNGHTTVFNAVHPPRLATGGANAQWLQLSISPTQDNLGGVLYYATWKTPSVNDATDFYLDVIGYDKARFPDLPTDTSAFAPNTIRYTTNQNTTVSHASYKRDNWRIYDNVWGFTTQQNIAENKDILVVSDYALGQKFAFSTFGQTGASNLPPKQFGTESYVTDVDEGILPDSAFYNYDEGSSPTFLAAVNATSASSGPDIPWPVIQHLNNYGSNNDLAGGSLFNTTTSTQILNGLGVGSYYDGIVGQQNDTDPAGTGYPYVKSQEYAIWRILCRGALPSSQLDDYAPVPTNQPALDASQAVPGTAQNEPAGTVQDAHQCVIWLSPYTNDLLTGPGTLADPTSQSELQNFASLGGRLFVTGQDVASGLTASGTTPTFLTSVLNATLSSANGGSETLTGAGNRISGSGQNGGGGLNFWGYLDTGGVGSIEFVDFSAPSSNPLLLGNTYNAPATERLDASLDQIGPALLPFGFNIYGNAVSDYVAQIDQVTPGAGATTDISDPAAGLIYTQNTTTSATGNTVVSKVVYASFGIEALSTEYYEWLSGTAFPAPTPVYEGGETQHFSPRNQRQNILHNIVDYLRTGSITGRIVQNANGTSGVGEPVVGATVYLIPNGTTTQPGARPYYTGTTDANGTYVISGVDPGTYGVGAYSLGFNANESKTSVEVEGDTINTEQNVDIEPQASGSISGTVTGANNVPISGATVTFTNTSNPSITASTTTNANGVYSVNAPVGTYNGVATDPPSYGTENYPGNPVTVTSSTATTGINFVLAVASSTITGTVTDSNGNDLAGVVVTATPSANATGVTTGAVSATTATNGTYTITPVAPGNYTLTATLSGYTQVGTPPTVTVPAGQTLSGQNLTLQQTNPVTVVITVDGNGIGISGATVTISQTGSSTSVTGTTNSSGQFTASGANALYPGTYNITISAPSFQTLSSTLTIPTTATSPYDAPEYTLTAQAPVTSGYTAGAFNLISYPNQVFPASGSAFDEVFGPLRSSANPTGYRSHAYSYDSAITNYVTDPAFPADGLRLGYGYFIYIYQPYTTYSLLGTAPTAASVTVPLQGGNGLDGWNMIGVPSTTAIPVSSLSVKINGTTVPFTQAATLYNSVSPTLYGYNPASNAYIAISSSGSLQPFQGYWLQAKQANLSLVIPTGVTATSSARPAARSQR